MLLGERLVESLERARVLRQQVGLVLLDIDGFKLVNNSLGHTVGDELLAIAARRIQHVLRSGDTLARVGGDELAILCNHVVQLDDVVVLAERVRAVFDEPFALDAGDLCLTASLGIAVSDGPFDSADRLFRDADVAMFAAKDQGRGGIEVFASSMRDRVVNRLEVESGLRRALACGEFVVHYQPLIRFDEAEVIGFEALVRWNHPERGIVAPLDFLPIAEETGLIVPLGELVLGEACGQAARWARESPHERPLTMAVNMSAGQLNDPDLVAMVKRALATAELDPSLLVLEITEDVLMVDREHAINVLRELSAHGVRIGIDDFGTGQSSLGYLRSLPVHTLKIDRSFIDGLGVNPEDSAIVAAVVHLGHALGLSVTAEGVETPRAGVGAAGARLRPRSGLLLRTPAVGGDRAGAGAPPLQVAPARRRLSREIPRGAVPMLR